MVTCRPVVLSPAPLQPCSAASFQQPVTRPDLAAQSGHTPCVIKSDLSCAADAPRRPSRQTRQSVIKEWPFGPPTLVFPVRQIGCVCEAAIAYQRRSNAHEKKTQRHLRHKDRGR